MIINTQYTLINSAEAAKILHIRRKNLSELVSQGAIRSYKFKTHILFRLKDIQKLEIQRIQVKRINKLATQ